MCTTDTWKVPVFTTKNSINFLSLHHSLQKTDRKDFHFKKIFLKLCDFQGKLDEVLGGFETFWNSEIHWLMWTTTNSEFSPIFQLVFHIRKPSIYDLDLAPLWIWLWGPKSNLPILQVCGIDFLTKLSVRENHLAVKMVACNSAEIYWPLILTQFKMTSTSFWTHCFNH